MRLTQGERDQLLAVARDMGLSLSTYMRQVVLSRPLPPRRVVRPIPEVNRQTYQALGQVAGLLNQLIYCLNEGRAKPETIEVLKSLDLVARLVGNVRAELLGTNFREAGSS